MTKDKILVINAGSSSIKFSLFLKDNLELVASGLAERITLEQGNLSIKYQGQKHSFDMELPNHQVAVEQVAKLLQEMNLISNKEEITNIGFRVVQGGTYFNKTTKLDNVAIMKIAQCSIYAPLHNPGAVMAIEGFKKVFPHATLSADFDTAFHTTIPAINSTYGIPKKLSDELNIKRYGAHGISHQYITEKLQKILNKENVTFVNMHLGNGASLCAVKNSKSIDTSMGLTPLAGIMMGTRSGDIDPSIHQFIMSQKNIDINELTTILNKQSGILGVSEVSSDMRDVRQAAAAGNYQAEFALELYAQKVADYLAVYANKIGGKPEALVFTAGIGENDHQMRARIISKTHFANVQLDQELNREDFEDFKLISAPTSEIPIYVIATNEELVIARNAKKIQ